MNEELASSRSESDGGESYTDEGRKSMEPNDEGVLELESCSDNETNSLNGLFHWQMEDYEVFHQECNMLQMREIKEEEKGTSSQTLLTKYKEHKKRLLEPKKMPTDKLECNKVQDGERKLEEKEERENKDERKRRETREKKTKLKNKEKSEKIKKY